MTFPCRNEIFLLIPCQVCYLKIVVLWDVSPCGSYKNTRFGGTYHLHLQHENNQRIRNTWRVTSNCSMLRRINWVINSSQHATVPSCSWRVLISLTAFILKMEAIRSSETSVLARTTQRCIPENYILHSHRRENFDSNKVRYLLNISAIEEWKFSDIFKCYFSLIDLTN
jgi:hypothetical protein